MAPVITGIKDMKIWNGLYQGSGSYSPQQYSVQLTTSFWSLGYLWMLDLNGWTDIWCHHLDGGGTIKCRHHKHPKKNTMYHPPGGAVCKIAENAGSDACCR